MRIGVVSEYFDRTGSTPTVLYDLVEHLRDQHPDLSFDVIASRNQYRGDHLLARHETLDRIEITRLATPKSNRPSTAARLAAGFIFSAAAFAELMRRTKHDVLLVVTNPPSLAMTTSAVSKLRGTPYVYLIHDLYPDVANVLGVLPARSPASLLLRRSQKLWLHGSARTVVLGRCMRNYLVDNYSMPAEQIDVIPNWADAEPVMPAETSRFRSSHNLEGVVALYSGNFGKHQDFDVILDAAKILQDAESPIVFVLAGKGAQEPHIVARIKNERIDNVRMFQLAQREEYADMLAAADIGLVTLARGTEGIGVPSKFYNILASGRPTVAVVAPSSEVALVLNESDSGIQVNTADSEGLAAALARLAASPPDRARMGANARRVLLENYTLPQIGEQFLESFRRAAGHPVVAGK